MELNRNSISARVYRDFYNQSQMPESLCPYFWKLVFAWPITIILAPLAFPIWIMERKSQDRMEVPMFVKALFSVALLAVLYLIFCIGVFISSYWITYYQKTIWYKWWIAGVTSSFIASVLIIFFGIYYSVGLYKERQRKLRYQAEWDENGNWIPVEDRQPLKSNIIVEFIRAKYNRYCPKIDWKDK
jgi:hypothetical protein